MWPACLEQGAVLQPPLARVRPAYSEVVAASLLLALAQAYSEVVAEPRAEQEADQRRLAVEEAGEEDWALCPRRWQWARAAVKV